MAARKVFREPQPRICKLRWLQQLLQMIKTSEVNWCEAIRRECVFGGWAEKAGRIDLLK